MVEFCLEVLQKVAFPNCYFISIYFYKLYR